MPTLPPTPVRGAVFLSYAREDTPSASRIADALRSSGVEVWLDQSELRGGDAWDQKIRRQIKDCVLFVPMISEATQSRGEGYFRLEWKLAVERTYLMAEGVPFLMPVAIDEVSSGDAIVPPEFLRVQWTRLPQGTPTQAFVEQIRWLLGAPRTAAPATAPTPYPFPRRKRFRVPSWALAVLITVVLLAGAAAWIVRRPSAASDAPISDKSIAVLPFANMSAEKDREFFADGIHEDLLTSLALIRDLRVVSRTSVAQYRGTDKPISQIAQELRVAYVLEGSVQRVGTRVRVTGQLIRAATDEHVWAKAYDRDLTDIFAIQSELAKAIAGALETVISPREKSLLDRRPTENVDAYDLFLKARDLSNREQQSAVTLGKEIALYEKAVVLDPTFAGAWAELADTCAYASFADYEGKAAYLERAKGAIQQASRLAPDDPDVIRDVGSYYYYGLRDYARATEEYERLARARPNDPTLFNDLALTQRREGLWAQSLANTRRAVELEPGNANYLRNLEATLQAARRYDELIGLQRRLAAMFPDQLIEAFGVAELSLQCYGSVSDGQAFFAGLTPEQSNSPLGLSLREAWARDTGDLAEAARLDRLQPYFDDSGEPHYRQAWNAAITLAALGDRRAAAARAGGFPAELRNRLESEPDNADYWGYLAEFEALLGQKDEALRCINRAVALNPESRDALDGPTYAGIRALIYAWVGEKDRAFAEFKRLVSVPEGVFAPLNDFNLMHHPAFAPLRNDPRIEALATDPKNSKPLF
jgi:TolB-like protein/regulator of sirC expression with transglutaminase-like and TPR domain